MSLAREPDVVVSLRPGEDALDRATDLRLRIVALEGALAISDRIVQPSLLDFLA